MCRTSTGDCAPAPRLPPLLGMPATQSLPAPPPQTQPTPNHAHQPTLLQLDTSSWDRVFPKNIPHQQNGSDCGVFTLLFADFAVSHTPPAPPCSGSGSAAGCVVRA